MDLFLKFNTGSIPFVKITPVLWNRFVQLTQVSWNRLLTYIGFLEQFVELTQVSWNHLL